MFGYICACVKVQMNYIVKWLRDHLSQYTISDTKIKFNKLTDSSIQIYALYTDCIFVLLSDPEESGFSGLHFPLSLN